MQKAFLITPFSAQRAGNEDPEVFKAVQETVTDSANPAGVDLLHPAEISTPGPIMNLIREEISSADVVLAILTGQNPNVFYELGIALESASRPAILIVRSPDDVPFDIRHHRYLTYGGPGELDRLPKALETAIRETLKMPVEETALEEEVARALVTFLEDRRILFVPLELWGARFPDDVGIASKGTRKSVQEIRKRLRQDLERLDRKSKLARSLLWFGVGPG